MQAAAKPRPQPRVPKRPRPPQAETPAVLRDIIEGDKLHGATAADAAGGELMTSRQVAEAQQRAQRAQLREGRGSESGAGPYWDQPLEEQEFLEFLLEDEDEDGAGGVGGLPREPGGSRGGAEGGAGARDDESQPFAHVPPEQLLRTIDLLRGNGVPESSIRYMIGDAPG
jgi:hypothetical protein